MKNIQCIIRKITSFLQQTSLDCHENNFVIMFSYEKLFMPIYDVIYHSPSVNSTEELYFHACTTSLYHVIEFSSAEK